MSRDLLKWLRDGQDPAVQYRTMVDLLGRSPQSPVARRARQAVMARGPIPRILGRQRADGGWAPVDRLYTSKYWGTVWTLILLAELGADGRHPDVRRACEHVLEYSQSRQSGGFSCRPARTGGGDEASVISCLTGNMAFSLARLGMSDDPRVLRAVGWIAANMRFDDGESEPPAGHRYRHQEACYGRHTCFHQVVKGLKALAEVPVERRSRAVRRCIAGGVDFMLRHQVYRSSHNPSRIGRPGWATFGFPLMWNTDALEVLGILGRLGARDPRMARAIKLVRSKQDSAGRWTLEQSWNGKMQVDIERKGKPSRWVTLRALLALRDCGALDAALAERTPGDGV